MKVKECRKSEEKSPVKVKICGLSRDVDIDYVNELQPDYIGFVFAKKSRRCVTPEHAAELKAKLDPRIPAVGVFRDTPAALAAGLANHGVIDCIQLHGQEDAAYLEGLRALMSAPVIQAFVIRSADDVQHALLSRADYLLFDGGAGNGVPFDWTLLRNVDRPFFLAGGLTPENVTSAIEACHPFAVDASSSLETDGVKDYRKIKRFIEAAS